MCTYTQVIDRLKRLAKTEWALAKLEGRSPLTEIFVQ